MTRHDDDLSAVFSALADPHRRAILERLGQGPVTVGALASPLPISAPAVSRHLKVLQDAGLVERAVDARWRTISVRPGSLDPAQAWVEEQRENWDARFDTLAQVLGGLGREEGRQ